MAFIGALCLLLILTTLAGHLANRIGIPSVIGQILVGIVVGPAMLGWIHLECHGFEWSGHAGLDSFG